MIRTLKALIGVNAKGDATLPEIEAALAGARAEIETAERNRNEAGSAYQAGLLTLDETALATLVADQQAAAIRRDRAAALAEALATKLDAARAQAAEIERRRRHAAAVRATDEAIKALRTYPGLVAPIIALLKQVAEAELLVSEVNADLPAGVEQIQPPELQVRGLPMVPRKEAEREIESDRWYYVGGEWNEEPVENGYQAECKPDGLLSRLGTLKRRTERNGMVEFRVAKRRRQRCWYVAALPSVAPDSLASTIMLPGLREGDPTLWEPAGSMSLIGGPSGGRAAEVLEHIRGLDGQLPQAGVARTGIRQWRFELLDDPSARTAVQA